MTYGGTNWGWLGMPENYTSYDYGAAIRETRQLDPKYYEDKLIGYFTQAVAPPDQDRSDHRRPRRTTPRSSTPRGCNPDTKTQFHVLRHADSTSTAVDTTHIAIDLNAQPAGDVSYTYDDPDPALQYTGAWSARRQPELHRRRLQAHRVVLQHRRRLADRAVHRHRGPLDRLEDEQPRLRRRLPRRRQAGDRRLRPAARTRPCCSQASGLADGPHTLKIVVDRHARVRLDRQLRVASTRSTCRSAATADPTYPTVPQQPGTAITLDGRDSHIIVANYQARRRRNCSTRPRRS